MCIRDRKKGEKVRVIDPEGKQVADFTAFNSKGPREYLSTGVTIDNNSSLYIKVGDYLYSVSYTHLFLVKVPVLSTHKTETAPSVSTEGRRRISEFFLASR